ncbi:male sterility protein-domain-containing protein [Coprinopsis sp. MPI-PUGE-AT-0042]|nr:male sterility protein-domain-containing protein [Coprinopsis sp. MPI-PUGE-AT-0042]
MHEMLEKYSTFTLPASLSSIKPSKPQGHVILVTGTTGALGSYLLDGFLRDETVSKVFTFNRRGPTANSMIERHLEGFAQKGLDPSVFLAYQGKWVMLEGDLTKEHFGLEEGDFLDLAREVTTIVHNAWTVNFGAPLQYFESQIEGVNKLLSFALASPQRPTVLFSSTFTTVQNAPPTSFPKREAPIPADWASITGYMKGKWVAEQLFSRASSVSVSGDQLRTIVVRVGQLCGGENGSWTRQEWFPSLIITAANLGMLPSCADSCVNWLPYTLAAKAYVDYAKHSVKGHQVTHLVHPRPIQWNDITSEVASELGLPMVPVEDWVKAVRTIASTPFPHSQTTPSLPLSPASTEQAKALTLKTQRQKYPMIKLLDYISASLLHAHRSKPYVDCTGVPVLDMENAMAFSPAMRDEKAIPMLDAKDMVGKWLVHWGLKAKVGKESVAKVASPLPQAKDFFVARL